MLGGEGIECFYRAIGCNRGTGIADIHNGSDSIVYGGGRSVVVLQRNDDLYHTSHYLPLSSPVKAVVWVKQITAEEAVIGCEDGHVIMWNTQENRIICKHSNSVIYVDSLTVQGICYIASSGGDSLVLVHRIDNPGDPSTQIASIQISRSGFAHCCALTTLQDAVVLALGTDDSAISLYDIDDDAVLLAKLQGHEDWVRCLNFRPIASGSILASASQDHYIRLWKIARQEEGEKSDGGFQLKVKKFSLRGQEYCITVENILLGHENWVTSVRWMSNGMMLSTSMDKTMIVWHQDSEGLWSENLHVGEVGGNNLGLFGGFPTADSSILISHSFQGAFQAWKRTDQGCVSLPMPGGHFGPVKDISWAPSGKYLISASTDQSVRVSAEWTERGWYEIARSQVHGHDMSCVDFISEGAYVSGSEEKVLRVFQATSTFYSNLRAISGCEVERDESADVIGAHIPALGLSNKAISKSDMETKIEHTGTATTKDYDIPYQVAFAPASLTQPPVEELLLQNTLWPELRKLYGHGYEVYQCAGSPDSTMVATSCKASKQQFAAVLLWECDNWTKSRQLVHHNLTVTRMKFSPDSSFLLTVSRDRDWAVWDVASASLVAASPPKCHARIIWDCAWFKDGSLSFATVSRDKKVKVWDSTEAHNTTDKWSCSCSRGFDAAITAIDISVIGVILLGFETGEISLVKRDSDQISVLCSVERTVCPTLTINTVQWRPGSEGTEFAVCSEDNNLLLLRVLLPSKNEE